MKIIIDSREQRPFDFLSQNGDIETERGTLDTGDYSVAGLESRVAVERKSLADLVTCLGVERERFQREMQRAAALEAFCVVVEAPWLALAEGKYRSRLSPASAMASVMAFTARHRVPFLFAGNREKAEVVTALFLRQYVKGKEHEWKAVQAAVAKKQREITGRLCRYCGRPLPVGVSVGRIYCCEQHRREYQNAQRKEERAEAREARKTDGEPMPDPWAHNDLDDWTAEDIYANALLDPCPDIYDAVEKRKKGKK